MIDLHIHSTYSDGSYTVKEILQEAENKNLEYISITDHDCVNAYKELENMNIKNYYKGNIIVGCEFKCYLEEFHIPIEILGYGFDLNIIKQYFENNHIMGVQKNYLEYLKKQGKKVGLVFDENLKLIDNHSYASAVFETELLKYSENKEIMKKHHISLEPNFYRAEQCNKNSIFYIDENKDFIGIQGLLEKIHEAKGLAFLAHPYIYPVDNVEEMVEYIANTYQLDGIECYYSTFTEEQKRTMINCTKKYNLYISGGTDFHGIPKPDIKMGNGRGNLQIPKEVILNWINKINKEYKNI